MKTLISEIDQSVNFVFGEGTEILESRYVRRERDYFIVYLSSHTGCNKSCRFCHLTATKQTSFNHVTPSQYAMQTKPVIDHYKTLEKANRVNFNFMARGEPLANQYVLERFPDVYSELVGTIEGLGLEHKINLSTIFPSESLDIDLEEEYGDYPVAIYYSLYSLKPEFRKRWLPKAIDPMIALDKLRQYQDATGKDVVFHWAFIKDQNDGLDTIEPILEEITKRRISGKFNLVRYNPYSDRHGEESTDEVIERNFKIMSEALSGNSRIVPRVGKDVYASCGMFVN